MQRGEVCWVELDPVVGAEIGKCRPAVILQNELANLSSTTVTVLPVSSNVRHVAPFHVLLPVGEAGLTVASKVLCEQIRTVSRDRVRTTIGRLSPAAVDQIRVALDRHLWF